MPVIGQGDVRVDTTDFERAMAEYIRLKRFSLERGVREQAKLLAKELIADTPPTKGTVDGKSMSARAAGRARVARDVKRAIRPLNPSDWKSKAIRDLIKARDYEGLEAVLSKFSSDKVLSFEAAIHLRAKAGNGRVRKQLAQATPDFKEHRDYVRKVQQRVGIAKGGWVKGYEAMGGKAAQWVRSHRDMGDVIDRSNDPRDPRVELLNDANWALDSMAKVVIGRAVQRRVGRMKRWIDGALAANARKAGLQ